MGGDKVLDVVANIGSHTPLLARAAVPKGMVCAFELTDYAFGKLTRNCSLYLQLTPRIRLLQCMLIDSDCGGAATPALYAIRPLKSAEGVHELNQGRLTPRSAAKARTLDSVIDSFGLERLDCIKLDIDGFECAMLRGAANVLRQWKPVIIIELAPYALAEQGSSVGGLLDLLNGYGYRLRDLSSGAPISSDPRVIEAQVPPGASLNIIAHVESIH